MFDESILKKGHTYAVALSGGEDSMCLYSMALSLREKHDIKVVAINVDHSIRGEESERDSDFVKNICKKDGIELFFKKVDVPKLAKEKGMSLEEAARILRYEVFYEAISSHFCDHVMTAHHLLDSIETILFKLFRGTSPSGLGGISKVSDDGCIIRPLVDTPKEEIHSYVLERGIQYVQDSTNQDSSYSRNYIRNEIIPIISKKFPYFSSGLMRFVDILSKESDYLDMIAQGLVKENGDEIYIMKDLDEVLFERACVCALKRMGIKKDYEKKHMEILLSLVKDQSGTTIALPKGVFAVSDYDRITFYTKKDVGEKESSIPFSSGCHNFNGRMLMLEPVSKRDYKPKRGKGILYADMDKFPSGSVIRYRQEGDEFVRFGGMKKKLKDYFIDIKVPARKRDQIPLICFGKRVLAIFGIEISNDVKIDNQTTNMLKLAIAMEENNNEQ